MNNEQYVRSRVYSPYHEIPWGSILRGRTLAGELAEAHLIPRQWTEDSNGYVYASKIPDVHDKWDLAFLLEKYTDGMKGFQLLTPSEFESSFIQDPSLNIIRGSRVASLSLGDFVVYGDSGRRVISVYNQDVGVEVSVGSIKTIYREVRHQYNWPSRVKIGDDSSNPVWDYFVKKTIGMIK